MRTNKHATVWACDYCPRTIEVEGIECAPMPPQWASVGVCRQGGSLSGGYTWENKELHFCDVCIEVHPDEVQACIWGLVAAVYP